MRVIVIASLAAICVCAVICATFGGNLDAFLAGVMLYICGQRAIGEIREWRKERKR